VAKAETPAARLAKWVERWKKILGLTEWDILVQVEDSKDDEDNDIVVLMNIEAPKNYRHAILHVYRVVFGLPVEKQEKCIVHELLHLRFRLVDGYLEDVLGCDGGVFSGWRNAMEGAIDGLANRLQEVCRAYRT
jgi:hypothetical protein